MRVRKRPGPAAGRHRRNPTMSRAPRHQVWEGTRRRRRARDGGRQTASLLAAHVPRRARTSFRCRPRSRSQGGCDARYTRPVTPIGPTTFPSVAPPPPPHHPHERRSCRRDCCCCCCRRGRRRRRILLSCRSPPPQSTNNIECVSLLFTARNATHAHQQPAPLPLDPYARDSAFTRILLDGF